MLQKIFLLGLFLGSAFGISDATLIKKAKNAGLKPIPKSQKQINKLINNPKNRLTKAKVELGKKLFFDPRLSKSGLISCNTCHNLAIGGVDGVSVAIGHKWAANPHHLNSPTVYNSVFNDVQFWDGRSKDLEDQAMGPIEALPEMAAPKELVEARINSIAEYVDEFRRVYGKKVKVDFALIASTIATFERTLVTPSRYDAFLNGKKNALSKKEKMGLSLFIDKGCVSCHSGYGLGGQMHVFNHDDYKGKGDFRGDKDSLVKAGILRNIASTAPYFHDGKVWELENAVWQMGKLQLGLDLKQDEVEKITAFLHSLSGKMPKITYPILPRSAKDTPKPDAN